MEKKYIDEVVGEVTLRKTARARGIGIRVHSDGSTSVSMPSWVRYDAGIRVLEARREWILAAREKFAKRNTGLDASASNVDIEKMREKARAELPPRLLELARLHGFKVNGVRVKHNRSNWGSCSVRGNINLNINLVRLPAELRDYVLLHELCHLRHMNHGREFHALLESVCPGHLELRRELKNWRII
jgi:predicted metal-dependent hydrolase